MSSIHDTVAGQQQVPVQHPTLTKPLRGPAAAPGMRLLLSVHWGWGRGSGLGGLPKCSAAQHSAEPRPQRPRNAWGSPGLSFSTGSLQAPCTAPGGSQGRNRTNDRDV